MKRIKKSATAGFDEKNDVLITVEPIVVGIEVDLTSKVMRQYGNHIKDFIIDTVKEAGYDGVKVVANDNSAWDYTIKARLLAALQRGSEA